MIDISKETSGAIKIESDGEAQYLANVENAFISGKENSYKGMDGSEKIIEPKISVSWSDGRLDLFLSDFTIDGVAQTDLEDAKAALADIFQNTTA